MSDAREPTVQRLGAMAGATVAVLCLLYTVVLGVGLATLPAPDRPIQAPWFTLMEVLILAIAPAMVVFAVAIYAAAGAPRKALAGAGVAFMGMSAGVTCVVHFSILTLGGQAAFAGAPWARQVFAFEWPSVAYALDILAWDVLFALAAWCLAWSVHGPGRRRVVRRLLLASAVLSFAGLAGVPLADMRVRDIGIVGYAVLFPVAAALMADIFRRGVSGSGDGRRRA